MLPGVLRCARLPPPARALSLSGPRMDLDPPPGPRMDPDPPPGPGRPVEQAIRTKLSQALAPSHLEVHNESHMHAVPPGAESHFRVLVVSPRFQGLAPLQRHRLVNQALRQELASSVHALAIQAKTPQQWSSNPGLDKSPACLGGSRGDPTVEEKLKAGRE